jgi:hypothetical protein
VRASPLSYRFRREGELKTSGRPRAAVPAVFSSPCHGTYSRDQPQTQARRRGRCDLVDLGLSLKVQHPASQTAPGSCGLPPCAVDRAPSSSLAHRTTSSLTCDRRPSDGSKRSRPSSTSPKAARRNRSSRPGTTASNSSVRPPPTCLLPAHLGQSGRRS